MKQMHDSIIKGYVRNIAVTLIAGLATWFGGGGTAQAELVSIDLTVASSPIYSGSATTAGGLVPLAGQVGVWNELALGDNFAVLNTTLSVTNALNGQGDGTNIDFFFNTGTTDFPAPRPLFLFSGAGGTDNLGNDIALIQDNSTVGWRFEGLTPNATYQIRFFGQIETTGVPNSFTTFTALGMPNVVATTTAIQNYVDLVIDSDALGNISGFFERANPVPGAISGVQILIPEPASTTAFGLMLGGILIRQRHRHNVR